MSPGINLEHQRWPNNRPQRTIDCATRLATQSLASLSIAAELNRYPTECALWPLETAYESRCL